MKILAFTDLHADKKLLHDLVLRAKKKDVDLVVCCGDFTIFGRGMRLVLEGLESIGKPIYLIPGNHEEKKGLLEQSLEGFSHCHSLHEKDAVVGDYIFLGYGGGGFAQEDAAFRAIARKWYGKYNGKKIVFITHGPPYGTKLDLLPMGHVGHKDYHKFIERIKPKVAISGHLHETVGAVDVIGKTKLVNPGWDGMVIELK
ncbi:MAG TPA: metallophosphoesterase [Candidatus Nanoarchaeia archaeon]|nr:metallophosphoesterase [Candidatus Nanoarchaeia archaeon]